jgi:hypothetical protein
MLFYIKYFNVLLILLIRSRRDSICKVHRKRAFIAVVQRPFDHHGRVRADEVARRGERKLNKIYSFGAAGIIYSPIEPAQ